MAVDLPELLISQWRNAPKLNALVAETTRIRDAALNVLAVLERRANVDEADGVFLDRLAARLGLMRPAIADPTVDTRFGFDDAGAGFDQHPFAGARANDAVYPLPDAVFRMLVKARAVLVLGDGTCATFTRAVRYIDAGASVTDQHNMTVRVVTAEPVLVRLADSVGALPRTAGVQMEIADRDRFGFDDAGVPFDTGPFAGSTS